MSKNCLLQIFAAGHTQKSQTLKTLILANLCSQNNCKACKHAHLHVQKMYVVLISCEKIHVHSCVKPLSKKSDSIGEGMLYIIGNKFACKSNKQVNIERKCSHKPHLSPASLITMKWWITYISCSTICMSKNVSSPTITCPLRTHYFDAKYLSYQ